MYGENKLCDDGGPTCAARKWGGAAGYLSVMPVDGFTLSYRLDYFDDRQGARGLLGTTVANATKVMGHTLTGTIAMYGGHFLIRPEVKYDMADGEVFGIAGDLKKDSITALVSFTGVY